MTRKKHTLKIRVRGLHGEIFDLADAEAGRADALYQQCQQHIAAALCGGE